jgi:hypothetical protein
MPKLIITPQSVLLTSGQAVTFEVSDGTGVAPKVSWNLSPQVGKFVVQDTSASGMPGASATYSSITYAAPAILTGAQSIAIVATTDADSASAAVSLTPDAITIVPATVDIEEGESQQFEAIVAPARVIGKDSTEREKITWVLSPDGQTGTLDQDGLYKAPAKISNSTSVSIIAASPAYGKHAVATVNLISPPWRGAGAYLLGFFLLLLFSLVIFMVGLWPPALPSPDAAKLSRTEAETTLQAKSDLLDKANKENVEAKAALDDSMKRAASVAGATQGKSQGSAPATDPSGAAKAEAATKSLERAQEAWDYAKKDLDKKRADESEVNQPKIRTRFVKQIDREIDLLLLVLLAGSLGSFLHIAPSFSDFMGNRTLKSTWAWWYALRPFIGAGLALVFYSATRAGLITSPATLNPFGVVAIAALVGMFSKDATAKLGEVFATLFKPSKPDEAKDKLVPRPPAPVQASGQPGAGK